MGIIFELVGRHVIFAIRSATRASGFRSCIPILARRGKDQKPIAKYFQLSGQESAIARVEETQYRNQNP